jgi:sec-independent protein translocase protein TatA
MGAFSIWHWLVVLAVVLLMFGGRGKISALMGDFGKGLTSFKKGMKEGDTAEADTEEAKALRADAASGEAPKGDQAAKS